MFKTKITPVCIEGCTYYTARLESDDHLMESLLKHRWFDHDARISSIPKLIRCIDIERLREKLDRFPNCNKDKSTIVFSSPYYNLEISNTIALVCRNHKFIRKTVSVSELKLYPSILAAIFEKISSYNPYAKTVTSEFSFKDLGIGELKYGRPRRRSRRVSIGKTTDYACSTIPVERFTGMHVKQYVDHFEINLCGFTFIVLDIEMKLIDKLRVFPKILPLIYVSLDEDSPVVINRDTSINPNRTIPIQFVKLVKQNIRFRDLKIYIGDYTYNATGLDNVIRVNNKKYRSDLILLVFETLKDMGTSDILDSLY